MKNNNFMAERIYVSALDMDGADYADTQDADIISIRQAIQRLTESNDQNDLALLNALERIFSI